jgi:hypothetical protein
VFKDLFKLSILESPTLPSLAYKLFTQTFLKHELELTFAETGLTGVYKLRQSILSQINKLSISNFFNKDRTLNDDELKDSLKHLYMFKDVLSNIKYTVELLTIIKIIISVVSNAAFIPIFVLANWALIRGGLRLISYLFTAVCAKFYIEAHTDHGSKISAITDWLRVASMNIHNWIFGDNLIPAPPKGGRGPVQISDYNILPQPVKSSSWYWDYLPASPEWIDWTIVGYTTGAFIIAATTYGIYTGAIDPISLSKRFGGFIIAYFAGTDGNDDSGNGGNDGGNGDAAVFDVDELDSDDDDDSQLADGALLTPRQKEDLQKLQGLPIIPKGMGGEDNWRDSSSTPSTSRPIAPDYVAPDWRTDKSGNPYNPDFAETLDSPERSEYKNYFRTPKSSPTKPAFTDDSSDDESKTPRADDTRSTTE